LASRSSCCCRGRGSAVLCSGWAFAQTEVDAGHHVHVAACFGELGMGGKADFLEGTPGVAGGFGEESDVEMCVEDGVRRRTGGAHHIGGREFAGEEREHFVHRAAAIGSNRQQRGAGAGGRFGAGDAEVVPGGVFDIVRVDGAVGLELLTAIRVASGVVERNAALPEMRGGLRGHQGEAVESAHGIGDADLGEIGDGAVHDVASGVLRHRGEKD